MVTGTPAAILDGALGILRAGGSVTLESAARRVGLTKAGLMYHFPTKEALMLVMVDRVVDRWERELTARAGGGVGDLTTPARIHAYLDFALTGQHDEADLAAFTDSRLRAKLTSRWLDRIEPWFHLEDTLDQRERAKFLALRLIADGTWFDEASGTKSLSDADRGLVLQLAHDLFPKERI